MNGHSGKFILFVVVKAIVGSYQRKYLYKNYGEMHYVNKCGFHGFLMLHCSIFCLSVSTFYGKA
jgi:hypothetical protein